MKYIPRCCCCLCTDIDSNLLKYLHKETFVFNDEMITYCKGYSEVNNCSVTNCFNLPISDIRICQLCMVQLENSFVFQKRCLASKQKLNQDYSIYQDENNNEATVQNAYFQDEILHSYDTTGTEMEEMEVLLDTESENGVVRNYWLTVSDETSEDENNQSQKIKIIKQKILQFQKKPKKQMQQCIIYAANLATTNDIEVYMNQIHSNLISCTLCVETFYSFAALKIHKEKQHLAQILTCTTCFRYFDEFCKFEEHVANAHQIKI
jgi:hypothetical protein